MTSKYGVEETTSSNQQDDMVGNVARKGGMRSPYNILVEKPEGKKPLGRSRRVCTRAV
jgi:hypothetical protein